MAAEHELFFARIQRELDDVFSEFFEQTRVSSGRWGFSPAVDVYYCSDPARVVVKVELAGIDISQLVLEIRGRELIIAGERRSAESEGCAFQLVEIERGPFQRSVQLGADVLPEVAKAVYENGILQIELPLERE